MPRRDHPAAQTATTHSCAAAASWDRRLKRPLRMLKPCWNGASTFVRTTMTCQGDNGLTGDAEKAEVAATVAKRSAVLIIVLYAYAIGTVRDYCMSHKEKAVTPFFVKLKSRTPGVTLVWICQRVSDKPLFKTFKIMIAGQPGRMSPGLADYSSDIFEITRKVMSHSPHSVPQGPGCRLRK